MTEHERPTHGHGSVLRRTDPDDRRALQIHLTETEGGLRNTVQRLRWDSRC